MDQYSTSIPQENIQLYLDSPLKFTPRTSELSVIKTRTLKFQHRGRNCYEKSEYWDPGQIFVSLIYMSLNLAVSRYILLLKIAFKKEGSFKD